MRLLQHEKYPPANRWWPCQRLRWWRCIRRSGASQQLNRLWLY